jgi:hypothetical protein
VDWTVDNWFPQSDDVAHICITGFMQLYKLFIPCPTIILFEYKFVVFRSIVPYIAWISSNEFHQCLMIHNFSVAEAGSYGQNWLMSNRAWNNAMHVGRQFPQETS